MININQQGLLYSVLFLLCGCLNTPIVASEVNHPAKDTLTKRCKVPANAFNQLPSNVLDGTNVIAINKFQPANISGTNFKTETGGASITISMQTLNGTHRIERNYSEPGTEKISTSFSQLCINDSYLYGENVRGIFTEKGILWLELKSEIEFIPSELWIYLEKN